MPEQMKIRMAEHIHTDEHMRSRDQETVDGGTDGIVAGTVLGKITATGVYVQHAPAATDGSQTVAGVLFEGVTGEDTRTVHKRACEVVKAHLTYSVGADANAITATDAALVALGIIPR
jgi:hypothetical protein